MFPYLKPLSLPPHQVMQLWYGCTSTGKLDRNGLYIFKILFPHCLAKVNSQCTFSVYAACYVGLPWWWLQKMGLLGCLPETTP